MPTKHSAGKRGIKVATLTVSPNFEVVIPPEIRDALGIRPGQRIQAFQYDNRIELIPDRPMREARGMLEGIDTSVKRERS